jgi:hypothetical protein
LAAALFGIGGVVSLLIAEDFVTVTKSETADWEELVPEIQNAIEEVLS